jgi:[acyl-carrier-protein] S-malonyltransferase
MKRVAILCPGRGSYTEKSLGSLPRDHAWVRRADELRAEHGLSSLAELDGAGKFESARHLAPADVSPLIWLVSMLDAARAGEEHRVVCVAGNSMGWYTALAVAGALDFDDGFRLVQEMSILQREQQASEGGGQILFPVVDESWGGVRSSKPPSPPRSQA